MRKKQIKSKLAKRNAAIALNQRRNARREEAIASLGGKCIVCEKTGGLYFSRRDPSEISQIRRLWTSPIEKFNEELELNVLRCYKCHALTRSNGRKWKHGTVYGYDKKDCRCDLCVTERRASRRRTYRNTRSKQSASIV